MLHPIGPVQTTLRELLGIARPRDLWFPEIRSLAGCIFLLGFVLYPYVYLPVRALFLMQSAATLEVARTLGAEPLRVFFRVAMPLARPAIAVGVSLALMEALNDIGASEFLGVRTLTVAIYTTWTVRMSVEGAAQIALVMLAVVFALILLERWARRRQRYSGQARRHHTPTPQPLGGSAALGATLACVAADPLRLPRPGELSRRRVVAALPGRRPAARAARVDREQRHARGDRHPRRRSSSAWCSPTPCGCRAIRAAPALVRLASIGYAVPGTVLAVGLLVPLASLDNARRRRHARALRHLHRPAPDRLGRGADPRLCAALPRHFRRRRSRPGLAKVSPHLDMAARSLGSRPAKMLAPSTCR